MNLNDGISLEDKELLRTQMSDYYSFAFPEFNLKDMFDNEPIRAKAADKNIKIALEVPPIELNSKPKPETPAAAPVEPNKSVAPAAQTQQPAKSVSTPSCDSFVHQLSHKYFGYKEMLYTFLLPSLNPV